jgi:hypothetical protein
MRPFTAELRVADCIDEILVPAFLKSTHLPSVAPSCLANARLLFEQVAGRILRHAISDCCLDHLLHSYGLRSARVFGVPLQAVYRPGCSLHANVARTSAWVRGRGHCFPLQRRMALSSRTDCIGRETMAVESGWSAQIATFAVQSSHNELAKWTLNCHSP